MTEPKDSGKTGMKMIVWYNTTLGRARDFTISSWPLKNAFSQTAYGTLPVPSMHWLKPANPTEKLLPESRRPQVSIYFVLQPTVVIVSMFTFLLIGERVCVCGCGLLWWDCIDCEYVLSVQVSGCSRLKVIIEAFSKNSPSQSCASLSLEVMRSFCETAGPLPLARLLS